MINLKESLTLSQEVSIYSEMIKGELSFNDLVFLYNSIKISQQQNPKQSFRLKGLEHKVAKLVRASRRELKPNDQYPLAEKYLQYRN